MYGVLANGKFAWSVKAEKLLNILSRIFLCIGGARGKIFPLLFENILILFLTDGKSLKFDIIDNVVNYNSFPLVLDILRSQYLTAENKILSCQTLYLKFCVSDGKTRDL